jgi:predicted DNA-binding transcriptional regulator AlpA
MRGTPVTPVPDKLLTEKDVAPILGVSVYTLQRWRVRRVGPRYVKLGRAIRYRMSDLLDFISGNTIGPSH